MTAMTNSDEKVGPPRAAVDASDVLASAVTLVGLARAPGRPRLVAPRLACVPFLARARPGGDRPDAAQEGAPLLWGLLPLASLFPFLFSLQGEPATPATAVTDPPRRATDREDRNDSDGPLTPLRLRDGAAHPAGLPRPPVLALRPADAPLAAARRASSDESAPVPAPASPLAVPLATTLATTLSSRAPAPAPHAAGPTPGARPSELPAGAQGRGADPLLVQVAPPRPTPPAAPRAAEYTWNPPLAARRQPTAPGSAPATRPASAAAHEPVSAPPRAAALSFTRPPELLPPPPLPFARPHSQEPLPELRPRSPARGMDLTEVVQNLRTVIEQTVIAEVKRTAAKLAPVEPAPRPAEVLAEVYTDHSIRKLMARMRRVEQEERHRRGAL